jgi:transposase-like protein
MRKLLKKYGFVPDKLVTDELRSYAAAASDLGIARLSVVNGATDPPSKWWTPLISS